ncbi:MAG: hypothetical protein Alpg2KO_07090 [Alphaproteobacteria bacterium]
MVPSDPPDDRDKRPDQGLPDGPRAQQDDILPPVPVGADKDVRPANPWGEAPAQALDTPMQVISGTVEEADFSASLTRVWHQRDEQSQQARQELMQALAELADEAADVGERASKVKKAGLPALQQVHGYCGEMNERVMGCVNQVRRETARLERVVEGARSGAVRRARFEYWRTWAEVHKLKLAMIGGGVLICLLIGLMIWQIAGGSSQ